MEWAILPGWTGWPVSMRPICASSILQRDSSLSNHALAAAVHVSPATCLRRSASREQGVIEREIAVLSPARLGAGLGAVVEVTLDQQGAEHQGNSSGSRAPSRASSSVIRSRAAPISC